MRAGFAVVLILLALIGLQTLWNVTTVGGDAQRVVKQYQPAAFNALALRAAIGDAAMQTAAQAEILTPGSARAIARARALASELQNLLSDPRDQHVAFEVAQGLRTVTDMPPPAAHTTLAELAQKLQALENRQLTAIRDAGEALVGKTRDTAIAVIISLVLAMSAVLLLMLGLNRGIIRPLKQTIARGVTTMAATLDGLVGADHHDLASIEHGRDDEVETVAETFDAMARALQQAIQNQQKAEQNLRRKVDRVLAAVRRAERGDLSARIEAGDGSEAMDELAAGIGHMLENLSGLVTQVQQAGIQVASSATQIAATAREQEAATAEQAASTSEIVASVAEISATAKELVHTMDEVRDVAEHTAASAADGQHALAAMETAMHQMRAATDAIGAKLAVLNEKAGNIGTVVTTINKVADQTNLLSLNAAIEAEKAGDYGRGFAVVASEIRRLADQTGAATWDIEQMVKEMQSAVSAGVMGMDKFSDQVGRGVAEVAQVSSRLAQIIEQVHTLTPRFETVTEGMHAQSEAAAQISESMSQLNETTQQTAESLRQSHDSVEQLKEAAYDLQAGVARFKVRAESLSMNRKLLLTFQIGCGTLRHRRRADPGNRAAGRTQADPAGRIVGRRSIRLPRPSDPGSGFMPDFRGPQCGMFHEHSYCRGFLCHRLGNRSTARI